MTQKHTPGQGLPIGSTARRRNAAWNACEGIPTDALDAGVVADMLEALRGLVGILTPMVVTAADGTVSVVESAEVIAARSAIARATGDTTGGAA